VADNTPSIQESAVSFVSDILGNLNNVVSNFAGVDVMWFRLVPDKRNQDVIFQAYTLYGVEDCPLSFKAMYADTGYDDAAITYNIMGINFAVPMTLDIALATWNEATGNDGTIPQKGDIVFIPMTRKLLEVASMQPVKQLGGQLTSYKVNLTIYTPTRSRIVGDNLRETIKDNTTNLNERFGEDIRNEVDSIVDDDQLSLFTSTSQDKQKTVSATPDEYGFMDIRSIIEYNLVVDGHTVSRSHYNMGIATDDVVVRYDRKYAFSSESPVVLSCWFRKHDNSIPNNIKNIKGGMTVTIEESEYFINVQTGAKFKAGSDVLIKRGIISIPGKVVETNKIKVNPEQIKNLDKTMPNWNNYPGFSIVTNQVLNLLSGNNLSIDIKGNFLSLSYSGKEILIQITSDINPTQWYAVILNISKDITLDIFGTEDGFKKISHSEGIKNTLYKETEEISFFIRSSEMDLINIRLFKAENLDIDTQIRDLISYNSKNDGYAIINDSADVYLNKPYIGKQR
jgi:hypothetical protein